MLFFILLTFISTCLATEQSFSEKGSYSVVRRSRQTYIYLCGGVPCQGNSNCAYRCVTTSWCVSFNIQWQCSNGCCTSGINTPAPPIIPPQPPQQQPLCGGRELSGGYCVNYQCGPGYICTVNGVCCRCAYGTSIGPCVNQACPDNTICNQNNECCPFNTAGR